MERKKERKGRWVDNAVHQTLIICFNKKKERKKERSGSITLYTGLLYFDGKKEIKKEKGDGSITLYIRHLSSCFFPDFCFNEKKERKKERMNE